MKIEYIQLQGIPKGHILDGILQLHNEIFGSTDDIVEKLKIKPPLLFQLALVGTEVVGYKIGYELDQKKFYSWLGGVKEEFRNNGVGSMLMEKQHQFLKAAGYKIVQTKTMNKWRSMLILNIKSGFDVIETYIDENGLHKIVLEKKL